MRRVVGFALFFVAVGIVFTLLVKHPLVDLLCAIVCVAVGYQLFCGECGK